MRSLGLHAGDHAREPTTNRLLWSAGGVRLGTFTCPPDHARWGRVNEAPGPAGFLFPRVAVRIDPLGGAGGVVDPGFAFTVRPGDCYRRTCLRPEGEHSAWIDVSTEAVARLGFDPEAVDPRFSLVRTPLEPALLAAQRRLFVEAERSGAPDPLFLEETLCGLIERLAGRQARAKGTLAEDLLALLAERYREPDGLADLARRLGVGASTLCRAFRRATGVTIHAHRERLRLAAALARLEDGEDDLTTLALDLGYASHAHFTT